MNARRRQRYIAHIAALIYIHRAKDDMRRMCAAIEAALLPACERLVAALRPLNTPEMRAWMAYAQAREDVE